MRIVCEFKLASEERIFIHNNTIDMIKEWLWRLEFPDAYGWGGSRMAMFAAQFREREPDIAKRTQELRPQLISELAAPTIRAECLIAVAGVPEITDSLRYPQYLVHSGRGRLELSITTDRNVIMGARPCKE
jgi:hypothetical protein